MTSPLSIKGMEMIPSLSKLQRRQGLQKYEKTKKWEAKSVDKKENSTHKNT